MRRFQLVFSYRHLFPLVAILAVIVTLGVSSSTSAAADPKPEPVEDSMHEFMEYVFQPTYRRLKAALAEKEPTNLTWKAVKSNALILAEGGNLLLIREPDSDVETWQKTSVAVRKLGGQLYQAARKKDAKASATAYRSMLNNCNRCHQKFADGKYQLKP